MRRSDQRRAALVALYQSEITGQTPADLLPPDAVEFTRELVDGVERERDRIDGLIERHAVGWTLDRIAPLERNILRIGLLELLVRDDVPDEVAIDEAVEAAKELCGADTPAFVNGVLGAAERDRAAAS